MRTTRLALFGGFLLVVLAFLAGGLSGTAFRGGRPFPSGGSLAPFGLSTGENPVPIGWIVDFLRIVLFGGLVLVVVGCLFSRTFRRHLLRLLLSLALILALWQLLAHRFTALYPEEPSGARPGASGSSEANEENEIVPRPPNWAVYLGAVAASLALALWLGPRLLSVMGQKRKRKAIQEIAREAAAELQRGASVLDVVLWAWMRMVEILSARAGTADRPSFTPREFAENLARLGFKHEAIELLTELFEEVRYGHKESESRREKALLALAALEKAYA